MLSKKVSTPETHTQPDNVETNLFILQVALDIMGPLPESSGNNLSLLIGDQFTKRYEAIPMSNQEASTVAKAFVNVWVSKFGCPANLHSDRGSNFMSNFFKNMREKLGTGHQQQLIILKETQ